MAKEKIKVSVIIDKEAVKKLAFSLSKTPEEYREVEKILNDNEEVVRDNTEETDEKVTAAGNRLFSKVALDTIICNNKDLIMSKNAEKACEDVDAIKAKVKKLFERLMTGSDKGDGNDAGTMKCVKLTKEQAKVIMEKLGSMFEEE